MTGILLVSQLFSRGLVSPALAAEARAADEDLRVAVVAEPWAAPFAPAELASALRLRLPRADVSVVARAEPRDRSERAIRVRWLGELPGLRVERGSGDAVELPLGDPARPGADPALVTRRAALFIALFADQAAPVASPPPVAGPRRAAPARWTSSAHLGPAFAVSDDGIATAMALTLRARRSLAAGASLEIGAKLSGEYGATIESQSLEVADRAFFAGVAYEAWLSTRVVVELGAALQYTHPVADIDGVGAVSRLDTPASMRLAVRTSAGLTWSPREHLTLGVSAATAFSFREREWVDDTGREVLGLGTMTIDLTAGAGVRW